MLMRLAFALAGASLLATAVPAQLKVNVALVNAVATVTDDSGHYVPDLTTDDFIVEEDGKPQTIAHFSQTDDLPVSVGVTLDTSGSMERKIATATEAVERFIRTIHEDDDIFLMTFSERPILRQDFTSNRDKLAAALRRVSVGGGTALYDAVDDSLQKVKRGQHEKRAILLITDGEDTSSAMDYNEAVRSVREAEVLVYCVGISPSSYGPMREGPPVITSPGGRNPGGRGPTINIPGIPGIPLPFPIPGRRPDIYPMQLPGGPSPANRDTVDMSVLNSFADASGAKAWLLSGTWTQGRGSQIEKILDEIAAELRNQYSIGYYPDHELKDGKWHRIEIRTKNPRYHVRTRREYFGK